MSSRRFPSGSRKYTEVPSTPRAPRRGTGPLSMGTPWAESRSTASLMGPCHTKQRSSEPAAGTAASCTLIMVLLAMREGNWRPAATRRRRGAGSRGPRGRKRATSRNPSRRGRRDRARRSREAVERREELEGLASGAGVVTGLPAGGFLGGHRAAQHDLAVARAHELVAETRHLVRGEIGEDRGGRLVVLVLEPGESLGAPEDGGELRSLPLPGGDPAFLARVLGARLEEETHGSPRHRDLEVAVLLVAALVEGKGDPGVVGRVDGAPGVLGHMGEGLVARDASHVGEEVAPNRFELGPDARPDGLHAGREAVDVEDLEVGGSETGERHAGASSGIPRV